MTATAILKTDIVKLSDCKVGDLMAYYGGLFRLDRLVCDEHTSKSGVPAHSAPGFRCFTSTFVGDLPGMTCAVPQSWRTNWTFQGNDLAAFARVRPDA